MHTVVCLATALAVPVLALAEPSPRRASAISLASTLVPCAIGAASFVSDAPEAGWMLGAPAIMLGPATGYLYGGLPGRGLAGVGLRLGAGVLTVLGVGSMFDESSDSTGGAYVALAGAVVVAGSAVFDLALVGRDVRRKNLSRAVTIVPWRSPSGAAGLALRAGF